MAKTCAARNIPARCRPMVAALQLVRNQDPDVLFLEWREDAACLVHSMGLAHQLAHVEEREWRRAFDRCLTVPDAVLELSDRCTT